MDTSSFPPASQFAQAFDALPEFLYWARDDLQARLRWTARARQDPKAAVPRGAGSFGGFVDVPALAAWAPLAARWVQESWHDTEALVLQLDLASLPAEVRRPQWPAHGVLWVTLDLHDSWTVRCYFDPRPREAIVWGPRHEAKGVKPCGLRFELQPCMPAWSGVEAIDNDYFREGGLLSQYETWCEQHFPMRQDGLRIGGSVHPIQGDAQSMDPDFFLCIEGMEFGDCGAIYVSYDPQKGFSGWATCA